MDTNNKTYFYIYETTNLINGKIYIGQHVTTNLSDGYLGSGKTMLKAIKKYGRASFKKEILMFAVNQVALNFIEKCLVTMEFVNDNGNYNLKEGGGSYGRHSESVKLRIGLLQKGKPKSQSFRDNLSRALKGRTFTKQTRSRISEKKMGAGNAMFGKTNAQHHLSAPFADVIHKETGEVCLDNFCAAEFCRQRDLNKSHFAAMLKGKRKSCGGWVLK